MTVSEMLSSNPELWRTDKSRLRMVHSDKPGIQAVKIAGCDPADMAAAAVINVANGAQLIDINMGCPAKKVNRKLAGSALLQYPDLIKQILIAVMGAGSPKLCTNCPIGRRLWYTGHHDSWPHPRLPVQRQRGVRQYSGS